MIKFITSEEESKKPTFGDVEIEQFFVDKDGDLCQKRSNSAYNVIAKANGEPYCAYADPVFPEEKISRILPKVTKIEF